MNKDVVRKTLNESPSKLTKRERDEEIMKLLHEFNTVKDACQIILGALANLEQCTIKEIHLKYGLPLKE